MFEDARSLSNEEALCMRPGLAGLGVKCSCTLTAQGLQMPFQKLADKYRGVKFVKVRLLA